LVLVIASGVIVVGRVSELLGDESCWMTRGKKSLLFRGNLFGEAGEGEGSFSFSLLFARA